MLAAIGLVPGACPSEASGSLKDETKRYLSKRLYSAKLCMLTQAENKKNYVEV